MSPNDDGTQLTAVESFSRVGNLAVGATYTRTVEITLPVDTAIDVETTVTKYFYVKTAAQEAPYEFVYGGTTTSRPQLRSR